MLLFGEHEAAAQAVRRAMRLTLDELPRGTQIDPPTGLGEQSLGVRGESRRGDVIHAYGWRVVNVIQRITVASAGRPGPNATLELARELEAKARE